VVARVPVVTGLSVSRNGVPVLSRSRGLSRLLRVDTRADTRCRRRHEDGPLAFVQKHGSPSAEADLTEEASPLAAPEKAGRSFASDKRRVALLTSVALVVAAGIAASAWWFLSPPLSTAAEWGGIGRESVIVGIRTENGGRFDVRVTGIDAEGSSAAARLDSVGLRSSPTAPRVETFAPITLKPGERTYVVLTYRIRCDEVTSSGGSLGGIAIRYDVFGIGRTKHIGSVSPAPELSPDRACG
jgi:hypothetical protein